MKIMPENKPELSATGKRLEQASGICGGMVWATFVFAMIFCNLVVAWNFLFFLPPAFLIITIILVFVRGVRGELLYFKSNTPPAPKTENTIDDDCQGSAWQASVGL